MKMLIDPAMWRQTDFQCGYFAGVLVALVTILFLMLLRIIIGIIFSSSRCRSITIVSPDGDMEIAADAISDLVKSLQPEFPNIVFDKLKMFQYGKKQVIQLQVSFNTANGGMPGQFDTLKGRVRDVLRETFGIVSIRKVSVCCHRVVIPEGSVAPKPTVPYTGESTQDSLKINFEHFEQQ